jgi:5-formyltetrahydrofolate cyclo-ligase
MNIPEAIQHPRGLALGGSWSALSGPHLTFTASEDILANGHGGSANHFTEGDMESKSILRSSLRKLRQASDSQYDFWNMCGGDLVSRLARCFEPGLCVAGYVALGSEVDPTPLLKKAAEKGCILALPFLTNRAAPMEFRSWREGEPLESAEYGFLQPLATAAPAAPDVIIVPLTGFDRAMNRLGQGAGHYDRIFPQFPAARRIGLGWSVQEVAALPADPWDVPLDMILTERELIASPTPRTMPK